MAADRELPQAVAAAADRLTELVDAFEAHPDVAVVERVFELLRCVDVVHRRGFQRLAELLNVAGLEQRALDDPEVELLFELYGLGEGRERTRAEEVLAGVRPYIESHGGRLEVVEAEAGVVTVRLSGACQGCRGSTATLRHVIEESLRDGLPGFARLEVQEPPEGVDRHDPVPGFVPLSALTAPPPRVLVWHNVLSLDEVLPDAVRGVQVEGEHVLLANLGGDLYAYANVCPGSPLPVHAGEVDDGVLRCPWHGCRFDLRSGRRVDGAGRPLHVVPVAVEGRDVRIGQLRAAS